MYYTLSRTWLDALALERESVFVREDCYKQETYAVTTKWSSQYDFITYYENYERNNIFKNGSKFIHFSNYTIFQELNK